MTNNAIATLGADIRRIIEQAQAKSDDGTPLDQVLVWLIAGIGASIGIAERKAQRLSDCRTQELDVDDLHRP